MKRKLKRLLCLMLSILILTSITAGLELSANAQTSGDFKYTILEDGTAEITDYTASEADVIIPSKIDGQSVSSISYKAFEYCENLESIIIPESVINIDASAIIYCPSLKKIVVDNDNPVYDSRNNCNAVIETDSNILMIGCASTVIPDGIVRIESDAFNGCKGLKSISIPDSVKSIGSFAFHQTSLISVFIPYSVEKIETSYQTYIYPFYECSQLEEIIVDENNPNYSSLDGVLFNKDKTKLLNYPDAKKDETYIIPSSVSELSNHTEYNNFPFYNNPFLKNLIFPEAVSFIDRTTTSYYMNLNVTILNPECKLYGLHTEGEISLQGVNKIFGFENSTAQQYAKSIGVEFVPLNKPIGIGIVEDSTDDTYTLGSKTETSIYCSYNLEDFISVTMDYETVDQSNYTLAEGSTILTFDPDYLDTLAMGEHTVTLNYTNASVYTTFVIVSIIGDVTGDGIVDAADAVMIQRYDAGLIDLTTQQLQAADVTGDGTVDAADAVRIQRYDAGLISSL